MGYAMKDRAAPWPQAGPPPDDERRSSERRPAWGDVFLYLDVRGLSPVVAQLIDTSSSGFRAAHSLAVLAPGREVCFRHSLASGTARAMWTRIEGNSIQSGFLILEHWPA